MSILLQSRSNRLAWCALLRVRGISRYKCTQRTRDLLLEIVRHTDTRSYNDGNDHHHHPSPPAASAAIHTTFNWILLPSPGFLHHLCQVVRGLSVGRWDPVYPAILPLHAVTHSTPNTRVSIIVKTHSELFIILNLSLQRIGGYSELAKTRKL